MTDHQSAMTDELPKSHPSVVSPDDWQAAWQQMLVKEKAFTRARDALAAERRSLETFRPAAYLAGERERVGLLLDRATRAMHSRTAADRALLARRGDRLPAQGRNESGRLNPPNPPGHAEAQRAAYLRLPSVER